VEKPQSDLTETCKGSDGSDGREKEMENRLGEYIEVKLSSGTLTESS
jgi:hypothetical protein